jgi:lysozyme family protein
MDQATMDHVLDRILSFEGGYVNNPNDRGGPTNFGITLKTLQNCRGVPVTALDVFNINRQEARDIYQKLYIFNPGFHEINDLDLAELVIDAGVNHGIRVATEWLQGAAGVKVDGIWGSVTKAAVNAADPRSLRAKVTAYRAQFYGKLISVDHKQAQFAAGWLNRLSYFIGKLKE